MTTAAIVPLDPAIHRDMVWCARCAGTQIFVEVFEFAGGRVGFCLGCGNERRIPFTHTTGKVA